MSSNGFNLFPTERTVTRRWTWKRSQTYIGLAWSTSTPNFKRRRYEKCAMSKILMDVTNNRRAQKSIVMVMQWSDYTKPLKFQIAIGFKTIRASFFPILMAVMWFWMEKIVYGYDNVNDFAI